MSTQYEGLLEHVERYAGDFRGAEPPDVMGGNRGFSLAVYEHPEYDMMTVVSNGVRFQSITSLLPEEFACSLHEEEENFARGIVHMIAEASVLGGEGLEYDKVIRFPQPIIPQSQVGGVVAAPHPYLSDEFDTFNGEQDRPVLQFITLIPATAAEVDFASEQGAEALVAKWTEQGTDLLSVYRGSVV